MSFAGRTAATIIATTSIRLQKIIELRHDLPNSEVSGCVISVHSITPSLIRFHQHNDTSVNLNQEKIQLFSVFFSIFIENVAVFRKWLHSV